MRSAPSEFVLPRLISEKCILACQQVAFQFRNVIDFSYCDDGELAQMRVYHDRLRVRITDNADTRTTFELRKFRFKLRAEIRTLQIVDRTHKSLSLGIRSKPPLFVPKCEL